jgi:pimeloyl-ACP methyl ester carboxylesterase
MGLSGDPAPQIAVVFVHGLFGDTLGTWSAGGDTPSFFKLLSNVADVGPQIDTYGFGFTSKMFGGGSLDIREAANKLRQSLEFDKVLDYQTIVFVGHSMGGLIIARSLAKVA